MFSEGRLRKQGCADVGAVVSEGRLFSQHHRPTGPAMVERLRWGGVQIEDVDRPWDTDARAALLWGYRALALSGSDGVGAPDTAAETSEVAESLVRLYAADLARVQVLQPIDEGTDEVDRAQAEAFVLDAVAEASG